MIHVRFKSDISLWVSSKCYFNLEYRIRILFHSYKRTQFLTLRNQRSVWSCVHNTRILVHISWEPNSGDEIVLFIRKDAQDCCGNNNIWLGLVKAFFDNNDAIHGGQLGLLKRNQHTKLHAPTGAPKLCRSQRREQRCCVAATALYSILYSTLQILLMLKKTCKIFHNIYTSKLKVLQNIIINSEKVH